MAAAAGRHGGLAAADHSRRTSLGRPISMLHAPELCLGVGAHNLMQLTACATAPSFTVASAVLESAFLTNAAALALLPARFFRLLSWTTAKAAACCDHTCKSKCCPEFPKWQFPLEYHVATACVMFAVVLTYSIASPLIVVVGLLYILLKATADRYVLLFGEDADLAERFSQEYDSFALYSSADTIILVAVFVMLLSNLQFVMEKQGPEGCGLAVLHSEFLGFRIDCRPFKHSLHSFTQALECTICPH